MQVDIPEQVEEAIKKLSDDTYPLQGNDRGV